MNVESLLAMFKRWIGIFLAELLAWPVLGPALGRSSARCAYEPQDVLDIRNLALAPNKQNAFLTPVAAASYLYRTRNPGNYKPSHPATFYTDEMQANKGHQFATVKQRIQENATFDASGWDVDALLAGWLLFFSMGSETVSGAGPFTHTFKFLQVSNQMPVTTLLCQETADVIYQIPDMAIADLVLSAKDFGPMQAQWKMVGSGKKVDGAVALPALSAPLFLLGSDTDVKMGPSAPDPQQPNQQFVLSTVVAGALAQHTAFYKLTYVNAAGETLGSAELSILVPANSVAKITMPATLPAGVTGVKVYAANATNTETLQAGGAVAAGGNLQEPNTGFVVGAALPTVTTALSSIKERVMDWQVHIACDMAPHRASGGGLWASFMKVLKQRATLQMTIGAKDTDDIRTLAESDTPRNIQYVTNSGAAAQLTMDFPQVWFEAPEIGVNGREMVWPITAQDNSVGKLGTQEPFSAVLINNQSAYGVGA